MQCPTRVFAPVDNYGGLKTRSGVQQWTWASNGAGSETDHQRGLRFGGQPRLMPTCYEEGLKKRLSLNYNILVG